MISDALPDAVAGFLPELQEIAPLGGLIFVGLWFTAKVLRFLFDLFTAGAPGTGRHL